MNEKLKRAVAIIALIFMAVFTVSLILYLIDKNMLNGAVGDMALWSGGFGLLLWLVLWLSRAFPSQQVKDEERERLYKEAEEAEAQKNLTDGDKQIDRFSEEKSVDNEQCDKTDEQEKN